MKITFENLTTKTAKTIEKSKKTTIDFIIEDIYFLYFPNWQKNDIELWKQGDLKINEFNYDHGTEFNSYKDYIVDEWLLDGVTEETLKAELLNGNGNNNFKIIEII